MDSDYSILASMTTQEFKSFKKAVALLTRNGFSFEEATGILATRMNSKKRFERENMPYLRTAVKVSQ